MFRTKVKNSTYQIQVDKDQLLLDGEIIDFDLANIGNDRYSLISNNKTYAVELVSIDQEKKVVELKVNNSLYEVAIKDKMDDLLEKLGIDNLLEAKSEDLKAPMPGLILEIAVEKGQQIFKGDKLLILEAMKMENVIKATSEGVVDKIDIEVGSSVDKGQILITFE